MGGIILWVNEDTSVSFPATDITVDSSLYDYAVLVCCTDITNNAHDIFSSGLTGKGENGVATQIHFTSSNLQRRNRHIEISEDGTNINISIAGKLTGGQTSSTKDTDIMIPVRIVGFKYT